MKRILREFDFLRNLYWAARKCFGSQPKTDAELLYNLRRACEKPTPQTAFDFPWGNFKCSDLGQIRAQFEEIFIRKEYKFSTSTTEPVIVDCGGNVGLSAIWFKLQYPGSKLTVYEPDPHLANYIEANLASAGLNGFVLHRKAVWIKDGLIGFEHTGDDKGKIQTNSTRLVEAVDLASHLPERTDLLKMDIEGAEYKVLNRLCETGAIDRVRNLVCEFHIFRGQEHEFIGTLHLLMKSGLQISMNWAAAGSWIGLATKESPFEVIGRNHVLLEVYGWR